jgi:hypothetical protein
MLENALREPSTNFKKIIIDLWINNLDNPSLIENYLGLFQKKGIDTDCFYWTSSELNPNTRELKEILSDKQFDLKEEEIEKIIQKYVRYTIQ